MLEPIWFLLTWLAVTLRLYIGVPWLYLNKWLAAPLRIINHKPMHRIVVVGDGFAEGVGDWTTVMVKSGLAYHLDKLIEGRGAARHPWVVDSFGQWQSTSRDWRPDAAAGAPKWRSLSCARTTPLLRAALQSEAYAQSCAVVLMLGSLDGARASRIISSQSGENVSLVARALSSGTLNISAAPGQLRARGSSKSSDATAPAVPARPVFVVGLPANCPEAEERNEAIRDELEELDGSAPIVFVDYPELSASDVCFDGMHPSAGGYAGLAALLASELEPVVMSVEVAMASAPPEQRGPALDSAAAAAVVSKRIKSKEAVFADEDRDAIAVALGSKLRRRADPRQAVLGMGAAGLPPVRDAVRMLAPGARL